MFSALINFFLCMCTACAFADTESCPPLASLHSTQDYVLDKQVNYFQTSTSCKIVPRVNPITGEYCEEEVDLVVAGSQPLSARRFYNHFGPYDPRYASWRYNPESVLVANFEWHEQEIFASVGDVDGSVCSFKRAKDTPYLFDFEVPKSFVIGGDGQSHPLNTKIQYWKAADPKNKQRFQYRCTVKDGSGRARFFDSTMHAWTGTVHFSEKKIGFGYGKIVNWSVFPNTWTPYYILISEERLPNGNILCYTSTPWKEETLNYPLPKLLHTITAYNADKTKILGSLHFEYPRVKNNEVGGVEITGSDLRKVGIQHVGTSPILLSAAYQPGQPAMSYQYKDRQLVSVEKAGRLLKTEYQPGTQKVAAQYAPVGPNGEMCPIARYTYQEQATLVYDAEGTQTIYRYDHNKKLIALELYEGSSLYRVERFEWDCSTGNLLKKILEDANGHPVQITEYQYDKNQNPILEKTGDGKLWRTTHRTYGDDGFNLKLTETCQEGRLVCYQYVPNTNLLASEFVYEGTCLRKRTFHSYDDCAICIKTIVDDGSSTDANNLEGVSCRKITVITPRQQLPCFGLPEVVEEKTIDALGQEILLHKVVYTYTAFGKVLKEEHYDANNTYDHCIINAYDEQERLITTVDPLGRTTHFTYDRNHQLASIAGPKPGQYKEITYDKANRPTQLADWQSDGSILVTGKKYDKLGRVIEQIDACKNSTRFEYDALSRLIAIYHPDGAIERKEYDLLGNLTKEIDPEGYVTQKTYNVFSQPLSIHYPDGSEEFFTYHSSGTLESHRDKNHATTFYTYDVFDHPIKAETYSSSGQLLKTVITTWSAFHKLSETVGECTVTYSYDFAARVLSEQRAYRTICYGYDTMGRLATTQEGDTITIKEYDCCNQVVESRVEKHGILQTQERYHYDEAGHPTQLIHSQGSTQTLFNSYGKPTRITDALGFTTHFTYDYQDVLHQTTESPKGIQSIIVHDRTGREATCLKKNMQGEVIQKYETGYDKNGNRTELVHTIFADTLPIKTLSHHWNYGPLGRLEEFTEACQQVTRYLYDDRGRLKTIIKPNGNSLMHDYDDLGRLVRFYASDVDYHYCYDQNDQVTSIYDGINKTTTYRSYDACGNITQEQLANGLRFSNVYDLQGRRTHLILPDHSKITYTYDGMFLHSVSRHHYTHTYSKRNLEGHILQITLPADMGLVSITRDALGRYINLQSDYYQEHYPKDAYDASGNLLNYCYLDQLGTTQCSYSYDDLDQLVAENDSSYSYDSIYNRLKKGDCEYDINPLCQVCDDGQYAYTYDACGNLISDGENNYVYDSLDRLIAIEKGDLRICYTYDCFHRRLSKTVSHQGTIQHLHYLWDGNHEIGVVENNKIQELRVLGEGLGAEIGAAVLYELHGHTFIPLHDHRGCVTTLLDPQTKQPVECYRYSAFGEEFTNNKLSPWRFSSKRVDAETALVFFGRRYYHPSLGRWITQDPEGFKDGPNLYAYLHNCPLLDCDLYGLFSKNKAVSTALNCFGLTGSVMNFFGIGKPNDYFEYEQQFSNKSGNFDLGRPELPVGRIGRTNGLFNRHRGIARATAFDSSDMAHGYNVHYTYKASHGISDLHEAAMNMRGINTAAVWALRKRLDDYFDNDTSGAPCYEECHSNGTTVLKNALMNYPEDRRQRIIVRAFAPASYIPRHLCRDVRHYVSDSDIVHRLDIAGKKECRDTTFILKRAPTASPLLDHSIDSPTFAQARQESILDYLNELARYQK